MNLKKFIKLSTYDGQYFFLKALQKKITISKINFIEWIQSYKMRISFEKNLWLNVYLRHS